MARSPKNVDWDAIENEYRMGIRSLRSIAEDFDVSHMTIQARAKTYEWTRDLSAKVKQKAEELIVKKELKEKNRRATEHEVIKTKAELQAGALITETEEIKRLKTICDSLESELEIIVDVDLDKRAKILSQLAMVKEKIINLRRRNLGISDNSNGDADSQKAITNVNYTIIDPNKNSIAPLKNRATDDIRAYP